MRRNNSRLYQLSHCTYICKYHIVWTTRYRQEFFEAEYNKGELKKMLRSISRWKKFVIEGWHVGSEHIHLYIVIPPKYSVAYAVSILKGKTSAWIKKKTKKLPTGSIWNRGYYVSTVGLNEYAVRKYVESHGKRYKELVVPMEFIKKE